MNMKRTPEERMAIAMWWLLQEIRYLFLAGREGMEAEFELHRQNDNTDIPEIEVQKALLKQLEEQKAIKMIHWGDDKYSLLGDEAFDSVYGFYETYIASMDPTKGLSVVFDEDEGTLTLGVKKCQLPPFGKEQLLCEVMFQYLQGEPVDRGRVFEHLQGTEAEINEQGKRMIKDTVRRVNKRVSETLGISSLFKIERGTLRRLR